MYKSHLRAYSYRIKRIYKLKLLKLLEYVYIKIHEELIIIF